MAEYEPKGVTVATGTPSTVKVPRLRVSLWIESSIDVVAQITDRKTGANVPKPARITDAGGVLDDASIISTLALNRTTPSAGHSAKWANALHVPFLTQARDQCHAAGIQLLAGYSLGPADNADQIKAFLSWIRGASGFASLQQHADDLLSFLDANGFQALDGLSFDVELNELAERDAPAFTTFYRYLASKLAARKQILAVATGTGVPPGSPNLIGTFKAQPFDMAVGSPNFIIRPMAYDVFNLSDDDFLKWQEQVLDYGLNTVGLKPGQLQLGLKVTSNTRPAEIPPGWSARKCCFDVNGVKERCQKVLRPRNVGVITFGNWIDVKTVNDGLNPGASPANRVGEPLQVPLTKTLP